MLDFEIQRCTRRCAKSQRELQPGETFFSVLIAEQADVVRLDYSASEWDGPPDECVGWWKSVMPDANAKQVNWAPNDVMLHYFDQTAALEEKAAVRYVLALLLVRRKILKLEATDVDDAGREVLKLYCPRKDTYFEANVTPLSASRIDEIQQQLSQVLFSHSN